MGGSAGVHTTHLGVLRPTLSRFFILSFLAVLKAGGMFLPMATEHVATKLKYVLEDARPLLLLAHSSDRPSHTRNIHWKTEIDTHTHTLCEEYTCFPDHYRFILTLGVCWNPSKTKLKFSSWMNWP